MLRVRQYLDDSVRAIGEAVARQDEFRGFENAAAANLGSCLAIWKVRSGLESAVLHRSRSCVGNIDMMLCGCPLYKKAREKYEKQLRNLTLTAILHSCRRRHEHNIEDRVPRRDLAGT